MRDTFLQVIQSHSELPQSWRDEMLRRIGSVQFKLRSEVGISGGEACGSSGLDINAFAYVDRADEGRRKIVMCPGLLLQSSLHPSTPSFDYILAHELGHHIDSQSLTQVGGDLIMPYYSYVGCLNHVLGTPGAVGSARGNLRDSLGVRDFYPALVSGNSPAEVLQALSYNASRYLCEGEVLSSGVRR